MSDQPAPNNVVELRERPRPNEPGDPMLNQLMRSPDQRVRMLVVIATGAASDVETLKRRLRGEKDLRFRERLARKLNDAELAYMSAVAGAVVLDSARFGIATRTLLARLIHLLGEPFDAEVGPPLNAFVRNPVPGNDMPCPLCEGPGTRNTPSGEIICMLCDESGQVNERIRELWEELGAVLAPRLVRGAEVPGER